MVWACRYAKHTECAAAQVVDVAVQDTLCLAVFCFYFFRLDAYCSVGTVVLAYPAGNTFVVTFFIINEVERSSESLRYDKRFPVLGVLFGNFAAEKVFACDAHAVQQAAESLKE